MRKSIIFFICLLLCGGQYLFAEETFSRGVGVVNFAKCTADSKYGKQEQEQMEQTKQHWSALMENTQNELQEIASKFEDQDFLDTLSPEAEQDLQMRYKTLSEELAKHQTQSMRELNQANYFLYYKLSGDIAKAAEKIADEKKLNVVMNKEACFYIRPDMEITNEVISEMDKNFETEQKEQAKNDETPPKEQNE